MGRRYGRTTQQFGIQLSFGTSNQPPFRTVHLQIEDRTSGLIVLESRLDADNLMSLLSGSEIRVPGEWLAHPERVGMNAERGYTTLNAWKVDETAADAYAAAWKDEHGWDVVSKRKNNKGEWVIDGTRWVPAAPAEQED